MITMEMILAGGVGIIAFFLKDLFTRFNKLESKVENTIVKYNQEFGKLVGKVSTIDSKTSSELKRIEEIMEIHFKQFSDKLEELQRIIEQRK